MRLRHHLYNTKVDVDISANALADVTCKQSFKVNVDVLTIVNPVVIFVTVTLFLPSK